MGRGDRARSFGRRPRERALIVVVVFFLGLVLARSFGRMKASVDTDGVLVVIDVEGSGVSMPGSRIFPMAEVPLSEVLAKFARSSACGRLPRPFPSPSRFLRYGDRITIESTSEGSRCRYRIHRSTSRFHLALGFKIDVNTASWDALMAVPGMRLPWVEVIAERRRMKPWKSLDDLALIKGIGAKRIRRWKAYMKAGRGRAFEPEKGSHR